VGEEEVEAAALLPGAGDLMGGVEDNKAISSTTTVLFPIILQSYFCLIPFIHH
jgi:hypothetical protein